MNTPPARFFLLVMLLSVPFYLLGATGLRLPGLPALPASALMTFIPLVAALILVRRQRGPGAAMSLFEGGVAMRRYPAIGWYLTALLFMPVVGIVEFAILRATDSAVPAPQIALDRALLLFLAFFVGAIGEEVGWQGYAYPALRSRQSALRAAAVVGTVWAAWHVIPFVQLGRSAEWIVWHSLSAVAMRVVIVWLFENTRQSVFVAVLFHTMINLSWVLFPVSGSFYDPFVTFVILAITVSSIIVVWGPDTLARSRRSPRA